MSGPDDPLLRALGDLAREAPAEAPAEALDGARLARFTEAAKRASATPAPPRTTPATTRARRGVLVRVAFGLAPLAAAAALVLVLRGGGRGGAGAPAPLDGYVVEVLAGDAPTRADGPTPSAGAVVLGARDDAPVVVVLRPSRVTRAGEALDVRVLRARGADVAPLAARVETADGAVRVESTAGALRDADALLVDLTVDGAARRARVPVTARAAPSPPPR